MLLNKQCPREHCACIVKQKGYELGCFLMRMYCRCQLDNNGYEAWRWPLFRGMNLGLVLEKGTWSTLDTVLFMTSVGKCKFMIQMALDATVLNLTQEVWSSSKVWRYGFSLLSFYAFEEGRASDRPDKAQAYHTAWFLLGIWEGVQGNKAGARRTGHMFCDEIL